MDNQNFGTNNPIPEPPKQEGSVNVRTQASDIQSIKQSGGGAPEPKSFSLGEINSARPPAPAYSPASPLPEESSFIPGGNIPGGNQNEPAVQNSWPTPDESTPASTSKIDWKKITLISGIAVLFGIIIYLGYAYIYPLLFNSAPSLSPAVSSSLPSEPEPEPEPPLPLIPVHSSFLSDSVSNIGSVTFFAATFKTDLTNLARSTSITPDLITQFNLQDINSNPIAFSDFFSSLVPTVNSENLSANFEDDFTAFLYIDSAENAWPGYIAKVKNDANLFDAQVVIQSLEDAVSFSDLFIETEGELLDSVFKDGQANSVPTRYLTFSNSKAALDYLWLNNYFVISTSYPGLQKVMPLISL